MRNLPRGKGRLMARMRWFIGIVAGVALLAGCAGLGKTGSQVFTPTEGAPAAAEPNTSAPGNWAGVVPWDIDGTGVVEVATKAQASLYPGDGKFTQSVSDIPFVPPPADARAVASLAGGDSYYYAEHVSPSEVQGLTFDPSGGPAFACYELALPSSAPFTIGVAWYSMPTDLDGYFIGIGDLTANVWHWYMGPDDGVLTFDPSEWGGQAGSRILACIALQDGKLADFWQLKAGVSEVRGTGLAFEKPPADKMLSKVEVAVASLPSQVDLTRFIHPVRNQGSMGSCTAFACTDASLSILLNQVYGAQGWDTVQNTLKPSPMWAYVKSGVSPIGNWTPLCGSSAGRYMSEAFNVLEQVGAAMEATVPYAATSNCSTTFPAQANTEASLVRIGDWYSIGGSGSTAETIKIQLGTFQRPVVIAMYNLEYTFLNYQSGVYQFNPTGESVPAGHAMCIVGYDDTLQAFQVRNSWGSSWGQGGYWWCSYSSVDAMVPRGRLYAYVMELAYNPAAASHFLGTAPINIDEVEPNDYPNLTNTLPAFPVDSFTGQLGNGDGADCYSFTHQAGYATDFSVVITGSLQLRLELYDTSGKLIYRPGVNDSSTRISGYWTTEGVAVIKAQWLNGEGYYLLSGSQRLPPSIPAGLSASDSLRPDAVELHWNASTNADSYRIERAVDPEGPFDDLGSTFNTTFTDTTAEHWRYYYYRVRANGNGGEGQPCAPDQGSRLAPAPTNLRASDGFYNGKVVLTWQMAPSSGITYTVRRSISREGPYVKLGETTGTTFEDTKVDRDVPYFYIANASKKAFRGPDSLPDQGYSHGLNTIGGETDVHPILPNEPGLETDPLPSNPGRVTVDDGSGGQPVPVQPTK
jgi:C1A family cysteine protease